MQNQPKSHNYFWPIILIGAGVILLLRNLDLIPAFNIGLLFRLWPLILVVIGLDIIFGHKAPWVGGLLGLLAVGGIIAFLVLSPSIGVVSPAGTTTDVISEPVGEASSAKYYLELSSDPVEVNALANSNDLIHGTIVHSGTLNFDVSGTTEKVVRLSETHDSSEWLQWNFVFGEQKWDIGINPDVSTAMVVDGGSGSVDVDLNGIALTSLRASMGSGSSQFYLPSSEDAYTADIESGSGSVNISLPGKTDIVLSLDSGSGSVNVSVPAGSGLRIEVMDSGSGSMNIPPRMEQTGGTASSETGTWQTVGFNEAANKIIIKILNRGSGSINIH